MKAPPEAAASIQPQTELELNLAAFLLRNDSRKAVSEKWFRGDFTVRRLNSQSWKLPMSVGFWSWQENEQQTSNTYDTYKQPISNT